MFLEKQQIYVVDSNSRNYSRNQIDFDTVSLSNNGRFVDYREGFIDIPVVIEYGTGATDVSAAAALSRIRVKNNLSLIDSISITYNNTTMVQESPEIASSLIFKQHVSMSQDDVTRADVFGYTKDSGAYGYSGDQGLTTNALATASAERTESPFHTVVDAGVLSAANLMASGVNVHEIDNVDNNRFHYFYYNCRIMLKDLSTFFEKMPLVKGASMRMSLRLNQGSITYTSNAGGAVTVTNSDLKGSSFPVMRMDAIGNSKAEKITVSVAKTDDAHQHVRKECRLYVPVYTLAPQFESQYLSQGSKKIVYDDVYINHIRSIGQGSFSSLITNGLARTKRLIVVPLISRASNGTLGLLPTESPFCSAPVTVSPQYCRLNVKVSGRNVYPSNVEYKYEHFMNELNGKFGLNSGQERGSSSSLISMKDYESVYGYFCVDLSRRHEEDDMTPLSLELFGSVESGKPLDFLCICEYEKDCVIDIATGQMVSM